MKSTLKQWRNPGRLLGKENRAFLTGPPIFQIISETDITFLVSSDLSIGSHHFFEMRVIDSHTKSMPGVFSQHLPDCTI